VRLERDAGGVVDRQSNAIRQPRLLEPISGRVDTRRREVHAGGPRRTCLNQREKQPAAPATELEHRPARGSEGQKRIPETIRDRNEDRILASGQTLGHPGVEMSSDPRIGRACTLRPRRVRPRIGHVVQVIVHRDTILRCEGARRSRSNWFAPFATMASVVRPVQRLLATESSNRESPMPAATRSRLRDHGSMPRGATPVRGMQAQYGHQPPTSRSMIATLAGLSGLAESPALLNRTCVRARPTGVGRARTHWGFRRIPIERADDGLAAWIETA